MVAPYVKFVAKKAVALALTLVLATYLVVIISNLGGYLDTLVRNQIIKEVTSRYAQRPEFQRLPKEEQEKILKREIEAELKARGLDKPFFPDRSLIYLRDALSLNLGRAMVIKSASGSSKVSAIILERLPWSVLLFTTGTILSVAIGIYLGLHMGRRALSKFDRGMSLSAIILQSIPPWYFGVLALLIFAYRLHWFPSGGWVKKFYGVPWYILAVDMLHHLALPLVCWVISTFGFWAYVTRNLVIYILYEDYVMAAKAKGVPEEMLIRRYVLRPAAPPIVTMTALALIASWQGAIITETVFKWFGLGYLYWQAIMALDAPIIIGLTVTYAYLLMITVLVLDIIYGLLDPRVRTGGG
ncbi:ABC transporter permease [Candidatus Bathyarchaeota archaeon]|nr:MAG: ABC transporter permease [Candidatus Bathyarchaeota archaeon]